MAIYRLLKSRSFDPEAISVMTDAYERLLRELHLKDRNDAITDIVARKIIEIASNQQIKDPEVVCRKTMEALDLKP